MELIVSSIKCQILLECLCFRSRYKVSFCPSRFYYFNLATAKRADDDATKFINSRIINAYANFGQELIKLRDDYVKMFGEPM